MLGVRVGDLVKLRCNLERFGREPKRQVHPAKGLAGPLLQFLGKCVPNVSPLALNCDEVRIDRFSPLRKRFGAAELLNQDS
jgi:hypothetical protein